MNEQVKQKLETVLCEPSAPEALVERTVRRCQAVTRGRLAEERLAGEGDALPLEERRRLAADGLLGRVSLRMDLPRGLDRDWLLSQEAFCRATDGPAAGVLAGLRQGTLLRRMTGGMERRAAAPRQAGPEKSGPGMKK